MICKTCGSEFDIENFDICPYCLSPVDDKAENHVANVCDFAMTDENLLCGDEFVETTIEEVFVKTGVEVAKDLEEEPEVRAPKEMLGMVWKNEEELDLPIEKLNLSARAYNVLKRNSINFVRELIRCVAENNLHTMRSAGAKTVDEILLAIKKYEAGEIVIADSIIESKKEPVEVYPFKNMSSDVEKLSVSALAKLGITSQAANAFVKQGWIVCGDLKEVSAKEIIKVVRKDNYEKVLQVAGWLEKDIIAIMRKFLDETAYERSGTVFKRRAMGDTLQCIAENQDTLSKDSITRERVRQIERKYANQIIPFSQVIIDLLRGNEKFVLVQDLLDLYENDDYGRIIVYSCKFLDMYQYLDFADMFILKNEDIDIELSIMVELRELIGSGMDIVDNIEELYSLLMEMGFEYLDVNAIKNLLRKYGYKIYGDYAVKGKVSYGVLCTEVIKKYFPLGIKLSQSDTEYNEDLLKLRDLVKSKYNVLELPESNRALSSALARCGLILRGRGMYIPEEFVEIDTDVLCDIKQSIDSRQENRIFYTELYSEFEGVLNLTFGIDNYNYLHGVLKKYYPFEYEYSKDYLLKNGASGSSADTISDRIYDYICEIGRPVTKKELMQQFPGFSNVMIITPFVNDKRLLQWEYNCYSCSGILDIEQTDINTLKIILSGVLNENNGYSSDAMLYKRAKVECPAFLTKNNMTSCMNLYYVASMLFDELFDFRRPHIGVRGRFESFSSKEVVLHMMGYPEELSYEKYKEVANNMAWSPVTIGMLFYEIEKDYVRVSDDKYIKRSLFSIAEADRVSIKEKIDLLMNDGILPLMSIDMDVLPEIEYQWNEFLLEAVIDLFYDDMLIVHPTIKDRRYQRGIVVLKEKNIDSYSHIVAHMMERFGIEAMTESQFLSFLVVHNLAKKMIPNELNNSDYVKKEGDLYIRVH